MFGQKDFLDSLLDSAMDQEARRKFKKMPTIGLKPREEQVKEAFKSVYAPENWEQGKVFAIIHRSPTGEFTLLGAYQEFVHMRRRKLFSAKVLSAPSGATKYIRCEGVVEVQDQLFVTGDHWLNPPRPLEPPHEEDSGQIRDVELSFDLFLGDLQVVARNVKIVVRLERNWIRRVTLRDTTQFVCPTNKSVFFFPKELDVLDAMSFENKVALKGVLHI